MHVNRCVCHNVQFRDLLKLSERIGRSDLDALQDKTQCGRGCGLCIPYIQVAMRERLARVPLDAPKTVTAG